MAIHPLNIPDTPEASQAAAIGDLQRQAAKLDRASVAAGQRVLASQVGSVVAPSGVDTLVFSAPAINIPTVASQVVVSWLLRVQSGAGAGDISYITLYEPTDFASGGGGAHPVGIDVGHVQNNAGPTWCYPILPPQAGAAGYTSNIISTVIFPYTLKTTDPTPGDRTFSLRVRNTGGFSTTCDSGRLWLLVL